MSGHHLLQQAYLQHKIDFRRFSFCFLRLVQKMKERKCQFVKYIFGGKVLWASHLHCMEFGRYGGKARFILFYLFRTLFLDSLVRYFFCTQGTGKGNPESYSKLTKGVNVDIRETLI
jgi:hypothetical protein